jgi:hypothetical protein
MKNFNFSERTVARPAGTGDRLAGDHVVLASVRSS